jgi:long-chain acyl-CoA synthetase
MAEATQIPALEFSTGSKTIADIVPMAAQKHASKAALMHKAGDEWVDVSYEELGETVKEVALGLLDLGIVKGDKVAILSNTRPEWTYANFGLLGAGAASVSVYQTNSPEECRYVLSHSESRAVFVEDGEQLAKIREIEGELPNLEFVIVFEPEGDIGDAIPLDELRERGRARDDADYERRVAAVGGDDVCLYIYTSGTTGPPKGVVLTHSNAAAVGYICNELGIVTSDDSTYLYLPLAHSFALTVHLAAYDVGGPIIYFGGDAKQIIPELAEAKPTYFPSVPRIFEKLYSMGTAALAKASPEDRERFDKAVEIGLKVRLAQHAGEDVPEDLQKAFDEADETVFKPVRQLFGGNLRQAITGAAPIAAEILKFFYAAGVPVLEGWGMTETTGIGTVNTLENFRFGTVGKPTPGTEVKIADDGEVLMRGISVFKEYWANPDATAETFEGEWLKTGDLGSIDDDGYLSITGRKKDIIITAGGKNLTPANLENDLKQSRWISQAVMYGDRRPYPVALITLDPEEILPWAKSEGEPEDLAELAKSDKVRELIQGELDAVNAKYAQVEQIKKFSILDHDLSQETGELTPTLKVKRNVVNERYEEIFNELYGGPA